MTDKTARPDAAPKGAAYCNQPGTSCFYGSGDICVNCNKQKGWRTMAPIAASMSPLQQRVATIRNKLVPIQDVIDSTECSEAQADAKTALVAILTELEHMLVVETAEHAVVAAAERHVQHANTQRYLRDAVHTLHTTRGQP